MIENASITTPNDNPEGSVQPFAYLWDPVSKTYVYTTDIETGKGYWVASVQDCIFALPSQVVTINLTAKNIAFNTDKITVPAGSHITVIFNNQDSGIPHNFAVYTDSSAQTPVFIGQIITGPATITYTFDAPTQPGTYFFRCDVHPTQMTGQFIVQ